jgi:hypothetical protein
VKLRVTVMAGSDDVEELDGLELPLDGTARLNV